MVEMLLQFKDYCLMFLFYDAVYINFSDSFMTVIVFVIEIEDLSYSYI